MPTLSGCVTYSVGTSTISISNGCSCGVNISYGTSTYYLTSGQSRSINILSGSNTLSVWGDCISTSSTTITGSGGGTVDPDPWPPTPGEDRASCGDWSIGNISGTVTGYANNYATIQFSVTAYSDVNFTTRGRICETSIRDSAGDSGNGGISNNVNINSYGSNTLTFTVSWYWPSSKGTQLTFTITDIYYALYLYASDTSQGMTSWCYASGTKTCTVTNSSARKEFTWGNGVTNISAGMNISEVITAAKWNELSANVNVSTRVSPGDVITAAIYNRVASALGVAQVSQNEVITSDHFNRLRDAYVR